MTTAPSASPALSPSEVTDDDLEREAARVRRHIWRERGAMGAGIVCGFAGLAAWVATGMALLFVAGLVVGGSVYRVLGPRGGPLDDPPGPRDPEAVAEVRRMTAGRGALTWLGSHLMTRAITTVIALGGLAGGFFVPGKLLAESMNDVIRGRMWGAAIGAIAASAVGYVVARALSRRVFGRTTSPFGSF